MTDEDEYGSEIMTERERKDAIEKFEGHIAKGLCGFCGTRWKRYGHTEWCKEK